MLTYAQLVKGTRVTIGLDTLDNDTVSGVIQNIPQNINGLINVLCDDGHSRDVKISHIWLEGGSPPLLGGGGTSVSVTTGAGITLTGYTGTVTSNSPAVGGVVTNPGGAVNGITISVYKDGVLAGSAVTDSAGVWTYTFPFLSNGVHTVQAKVAPVIPSPVASATVVGQPVYPAPDIALDAVTLKEQGQSWASVGVDKATFGPHGYAVNGLSVNYLFNNSQNLKGQMSYSQFNTAYVGNDATTGGFNTFDISNNGGGQWATLGASPALTSGQAYNLTVRWGVPTTGSDGGWQLRTTGAAALYGADTKTTNGPGSGQIVPGTPAVATGTGCTLVSSITGTTSGVPWIEQSYTIIAQSSAALTVQMTTYTAGNLKIWGAQLSTGAAKRAWQATAGSTLSIGGNSVDLAGAIDAMVKTSAWTLHVETGELPATWDVLLAQYGSTSLAKIHGPSEMSFKSDDSLKIPHGEGGGYLGIQSWTIANDGTSAVYCVNGGPVQTGPALTLSGTVKLLGGATTNLRKIEAWSSKLSNANVKLATSLFNRDYPDLDNAEGSMANCGRKAGTQFFDDFDDASTFATRNAGQELVAHGNYQSIVNDYGPGNWFDAFPFHLGPIGSEGQTINQEDELYYTRAWVAAKAAAGLLGGETWRPFTLAATKTGAPANSCMVVNTQKLSNTTSAFQALVPARTSFELAAGVPVHTYASGCFGSQGRVEFGSNSYHAWRAKMSTGIHLWDAVWGTDIYSDIEIDVHEDAKITAAKATLVRTGAHWGNYTFNYSWPNYDAGFNLQDYFCTYGAVWLPTGQLIYTFCGRVIANRMTGGGFASTTTRMHLKGNNAVGGSYPGPADAGTAAAMPAEFCIDYAFITPISY